MKRDYRVLGWYIFFGTLGILPVVWDPTRIPQHGRHHFFKSRPIGSLSHRMRRRVFLALNRALEGTSIRRSKRGVLQPIESGAPVVPIPPGINGIVSAINLLQRGVVLQLQVGTYNEDLTKLTTNPTGISIIGVGAPGSVTTNLPIASYLTSDMSIINITGAPNAANTISWIRCMWAQTVVTAPTLASPRALIYGQSSVNNKFVHNLFVDFGCPITKQHGPYLFTFWNQYRQSNTPPAGGVAASDNGAQGPFTSVDDSWDYTTSGGLYVGYNGSTLATTYFDNYEIVRPQFGLSGIFSNDVCIDLEFGNTKGIGTVLVDHPRFYNAKLAYIQNVARITVENPYQRLTRDYNGPGGPTLLADASTSGISYLGSVIVNNPVHIEETCSVQPSANLKTGSLYAFTNTNYVHSWVSRGGLFIINGANAAQAAPRAYVKISAPTTNGTNNWCDEVEVTDITFGWNLAVGAQAGPANTIIPLFLVDSQAATTTLGRVRFSARHLGTTGGLTTAVAVGASTFTYTHGTSGATPAKIDGTVSLNWNAATVTSIVVTTKNGTVITDAVGAGSPSSLIRSYWMQIGETMAVSYSAGAPTMAYYNDGNLPATTAGDGTHPLYSYFFNGGNAGNAMTVTDEELYGCNQSALAAAAVTGYSIRAGTYTATRRVSRNKLPVDATFSFAAGGSPYTYKHGTQGATPAQGSGYLNITPGGTISQVTLNGQIMKAAEVIADYNLAVEIDDVVVITWATTAPTINYVGRRA